MNKIEGLIGIARKAGYAVVGGESLKNYTKKLYLVLLDKSAGNSLKREMQFLSNNRNVDLLEIENLGYLAGIENCKAIGIRNKVFSENIVKCLKGE